MSIILAWIKRIVEIGILEFLATLGWKVWAGLILTVVALAGLVIVLTLILVAILF